MAFPIAQAIALIDQSRAAASAPKLAGLPAPPEFGSKQSERALFQHVAAADRRDRPCCHHPATQGRASLAPRRRVCPSEDVGRSRCQSADRPRRSGHSALSSLSGNLSASVSPASGSRAASSSRRLSICSRAELAFQALMPVLVLQPAYLRARQARGHRRRAEKGLQGLPLSRRRRQSGSAGHEPQRWQPGRPLLRCHRAWS